MKRRAVEAVVFDMDGVLIDSEPLWREVEIEVFAQVGLTLTDEMCMQTMGMRINEVVDHWHGLHPWDSPSREEVAQAIVDGVARAIRERGALQEGAEEAVNFFRRLGLRLALASSSFYLLIHAVLETWGLRDRFEVVHSAEEERYGKPRPDVYLTTARKLGLAPELCLAIEDSPNGVLAAKAAGMACIAVTGERRHGDEGFEQADAMLGSLLEVDDRIWEETGTTPAPDLPATG